MLPLSAAWWTQRTSKQSTQRFLQGAMAQHRAGSLFEAASRYRRALAQDRKLAPALMGLADIEIRNGRVAQAVTLLEQASKLKTNEPVIWANLGRAAQSGALQRGGRGQQTWRRSLSRTVSV
jgi:Flp pilus assembly protein TadD